MKKIIGIIKTAFDTINRDNITVYSAYASFYMFISFIPFLIMLFMLAGEFFTISSEDFVALAGNNLPKDVITFIAYIIDEVLSSNAISMISLPALTLLWTASRTVVAVIRGMDCVYKSKTERGFFKLNFVSVFYTFSFLIAIIFSLTLMVFGNVVADALGTVFPVAENIINMILSARSLIALLALTAFFTCMYTFFPSGKQRMRDQVPGAVFSASGWMIFSLLFSLYIDNFSDKSYVYGSLTVIIVLMLWIYFCMVIMFIGGEINYFLINDKNNIDSFSTT